MKNGRQLGKKEPVKVKNPIPPMRRSTSGPMLTDVSVGSDSLPLPRTITTNYF